MPETQSADEHLSAEATLFRGRRAVRLSNGCISLVALTGGGHIAELRFEDSEINPLWQPHWDTIEPEEYDPVRYPQYGNVEGRLLASISGHLLCLNHYGELSEAEVAADGFENGEAPNLPWQVFELGANSGETRVVYGLDLPEAGMRFQRTIVLRRGESVAHIDEELTNVRRSDSPLAYQHHVTLGAPFVAPGETRLDLSGTRGHSYPRSFGAVDPLEPDRMFTWPVGPGVERLDVFPTIKPLCSVCTVALDGGQDDLAFVAASNPRLGLLVAYVFPVRMFPWTALWYENGGSTYAPYNGQVVAWGIEIGTCPLPMSRIETLASGPLLGRRRFGVIAARETLRTSYQAILLRIPSDWKGVASIVLDDGHVVATERQTGRRLQAGGEQ